MGEIRSGHERGEKCKHYFAVETYEACPESKDTKVLHMYNIFKLQKRLCV